MKEMIKKLYNKYLVENVTTFNFDDYIYFIDNDSNIFGILKESITENEVNLILTTYKIFKSDNLYDDTFSFLEYLFGLSNNKIPFKKLKYYFIKIEDLQDDFLQSELFNIFKDSFSNKVYITKRQDIYIILTEFNENIEFESILKLIESDFLIKVFGYESEYIEVNRKLPKHFQIDFNCFKQFQKLNDLCVTKSKLIINYIFNNIDDDIKLKIKEYVLKDYINDYEMITVVKMYFETNFNTTLAAKRCYMHRNTFLNKIDKFIDITNFNLRNYQEAFIVYVALII